MKRILFAVALAAVVAMLVLHQADATVLTTSNRVSYTGNGVTTLFTVPYKILAASDLLVTVNGTTKTLTTHYSVTGAGTSSTSITFVAAPANGTAIVISRVRPYAQTRQLRGQGAFTPSTIESALDDMEMQIQQIVGADGGLPGNNGVWAGSPAGSFLRDQTSTRGTINLNATAAPSAPAEGDVWIDDIDLVLRVVMDGTTATVLTDQTAVLAPATSVTTATVTATTVNVIDHLAITDRATPPAAPGAGINLYANTRGTTFAIPSWRTAGEADVTQPPGVESNWAVHCIAGIPGSATLGGSNIFSTITTGTATSRSPAASTVIASMHAVDLVSAAGAGSSAGLEGNVALSFRGDAAGLGGFLFYARFGTTTALAQQRAFVGVSSTVIAFANVNPSTLLNGVYIGYDSTQTTLRACGNDGAGTATCVDLGANFPVNATAIYDVYLYSPPAGTSVKYAVERLDSSFFASGTISAAGDLPSTSTFLTPHVWVNNGTTASAATLRLGKTCITSHY